MFLHEDGKSKSAVMEDVAASKEPGGAGSPGAGVGGIPARDLPLAPSARCSPRTPECPFGLAGHVPAAQEGASFSRRSGVVRGQNVEGLLVLPACHLGAGELLPTGTSPLLLYQGPDGLLLDGWETNRTNEGVPSVGFEGSV